MSTAPPPNAAAALDCCRCPKPEGCYGRAGFHYMLSERFPDAPSAAVVYERCGEHAEVLSALREAEATLQALGGVALSGSADEREQVRTQREIVRHWKTRLERLNGVLDVER